MNAFSRWIRWDFDNSACPDSPEQGQIACVTEMPHTRAP